MSSLSSNVKMIRKGYCYLADMNPPRKSKPGKVRPVIVIQSQDIIDAGSAGVVVVPVTSQVLTENILRIHLSPSQTLKLKKASDVLLDQIHTIDRHLFLEEIGKIPEKTFQKVLEGIKFLLEI